MFVSVLVADGAGAAVLQASDKGGICSSPYLTSDYSEHIYLKNSDTVHPQERIKSQGKEFLPRNMIHMPGGPHVLKRAVNGMAEVLLKAHVRSFRSDKSGYGYPRRSRRHKNKSRGQSRLNGDRWWIQCRSDRL